MTNFSKRPKRPDKPSIDIADTFTTPRKTSRKNTSIRMYPELMKYLQLWSRMQDTNASDTIEKAVLAYMNVTLEDVLHTPIPQNINKTDTK